MPQSNWKVTHLCVSPHIWFCNVRKMNHRWSGFFFSEVNSFWQSLPSLMHDFLLIMGWTCFARLLGSKLWNYDDSINEAAASFQTSVEFSHGTTNPQTMSCHILMMHEFIGWRMDASRRVSFLVSPMTSCSCCGMSVVQCSASGFRMSMLMRQYRGASKLERNVNTLPSLVMYEYWALKLSTSLTQGNRPGERRNTI